MTLKLLFFLEMFLRRKYIKLWGGSYYKNCYATFEKQKGL